jgi:hypothetical protein
VYTVSTLTLAKEMPSSFFRVFGTAFSVAVTLLWIGVSLGTLWKAATGEIFFAPCLKDLEGRESERRKGHPRFWNRVKGDEEAGKEH